MESYKEEEFSELPAEMLMMLLLTSDYLSCGVEEVWEEELMAWVGDNKRDMVEVAQMMETLLFGLLEPDFYLRRVLQGILTWAIEGLTLFSQDILSPYSSPQGQDLSL